MSKPKPGSTTLWAFLWAAGSHWVTLMSGGVITVAVALYERLSVRNVPAWVYITILVGFAFWACYLAWRDSLKNNLTLEVRLKEKDSLKLIFDVDEQGSRVYLQAHPNQPLIVTALIKLRFENKDIYPTSMKKLYFTLCVKQEGGAPKEIFTLLRMQYSMNGVEIKKEAFEGMMIQERRLTPFYMVEVWLSLDDDEIKTAADLSWNHFLHIIMDASNQELFEREFYLSWQDATKEGGTSLTRLRRSRVLTRRHRID